MIHSRKPKHGNLADSMHGLAIAGNIVKYSLSSPCPSCMEESIRPSRQLYVANISYPCMNQEIRLENVSRIKDHIEAQIVTRGRTTTLKLINVPNEEESEYCLHELSDFIIAEVIEDIQSKGLRMKAVQNVAHFLSSYSLNQYYLILKTYNAITTYLEFDRLPRFEKDVAPRARKESLFGKRQKAVEKSGRTMKKSIKKPKRRFRGSKRAINLSLLTNQERYDLRHGIPIPIKTEKRKEHEYKFHVFKEWNNETNFYKGA